MSQYSQDVVLAVEICQLVCTPLGLGQIVIRASDQAERRGPRFPLAIFLVAESMHRGEEVARTCTVREWGTVGGWRDLIGKRILLSRAENHTRVCNVAAEEDECRPFWAGCRPSKCGKMSYGVARCAQKVEAPVVEIVIRLELSDSQDLVVVGCKFHLDGAPPLVCVSRRLRSLGILRPSRQVFLLVSRPNHQPRGAWEFGGVANVIEMMVAEDDSIDVAWLDTMFDQDFRDIFLHTDLHVHLPQPFQQVWTEMRSKVLPNAQVEEETRVGRLVVDVEYICWTSIPFESRIQRLEDERMRDIADPGRAVDD